MIFLPTKKLKAKMKKLIGLTFLLAIGVCLVSLQKQSTINIQFSKHLLNTCLFKWVKTNKKTNTFNW